MDPMIVVQPHLDDAALSVGQFLAGRPDAIVATVCTGVPERWRMLTPYDAGCGFSSARAAMSRRWVEDQQAMQTLGARGVPLGLLDGQYTDGHPPDVHQIAERLRTLWLEERMDMVPDPILVGPLGVAHPDHLQTSDACLELWGRRPEITLWLYEEHPARVLWPEQIAARLDVLRGLGLRPELGFLGTGDMNTKWRAVHRYQSQIGALQEVAGPDLHPVWCPERVWKINGAPS